MSTIKVVLFDLDGIVLLKQKYRFSERFSAEYDVPMDLVSEFFTQKLKPCSIGRADLKVELAPYLEKWKWRGSVEGFMDYWFSTEKERDYHVLKTVKWLRDRKVRCCIATRQEKYRKEYLMNVVGLADHFDHCYCTCDIGVDKSEPKFFDYVLVNESVKPHQVMFVDDSQANVDAAKSLGIYAHLCESRSTLDKLLNPVLFV